MRYPKALGWWHKLPIRNGGDHTYDGDGNRVQKTGCGSIAYWRKSGNTLDEASTSGTMLREYVFFNGQRIARRDVSTDNVFYFFSNHLGSTSLMTNSAGAMPPQMESDYYPYGGEIPITTGIQDQNYKFTGKERDSTTGLDNFGNRYDSSSLGRFMTTDPIFITKHRLIDPQQWNLYAYVRNNPINLTDPTGLDFNLSCDKNNGTTCQGGHQYYQGKNGKYQETVVKSDKDGNLTDQSGNKYKGTFDGKTVSFADGNGNKSAGSWIQGSNKTSGITGGGKLDSRFGFTFMDHGKGQDLHAEFTFAGTTRQAADALRNAGFAGPKHGFHSGYDEFRSRGTKMMGAGSGHFDVRQEETEDSYGPVYGDVHTPEHNPGSWLGWIPHLGEQ